MAEVLAPGLEALAGAAAPRQSDMVPNVVIPTACAVGVIFAVILWQRVSKISMTGGSTFRSQNGREYLLVGGRGPRVQHCKGAGAVAGARRAPGGLPTADSC